MNYKLKIVVVIVVFPMMFYNLMYYGHNYSTIRDNITSYTHTRRIDDNLDDNGSLDDNLDDNGSLDDDSPTAATRHNGTTSIVNTRASVNLATNIYQENSTNTYENEKFVSDKSFPKVVTTPYENPIEAYQHSISLLNSIRSHCRTHNKSTSFDYNTAFRRPRMLIMTKSAALSHQLLYASNPKTGSSSFKKFLFSLDGAYNASDVHNHPQGHYKIVERKLNIGSLTRFIKLLKIGFIRNPLTRLVSAFRDKQLRVKKYLTPGLDYRENTTDSAVFDLFVDEIIAKDRWPADVHLMPQWKNMKVCSWPYDYLLQYEHSATGIHVIQTLTNTSHLQYPGSRSQVGKDAIATDDIAREYYSNLSPARMRAIYDRYDMDFKLLGYSKFGDVDFPNVRIDK